MKALTFELHLVEPLLATRLGGGDPNSAVGFEFIPGSMIRGMLIARYTKQHSADAANPDFRRLFIDGSTLFLNAYPRMWGKRALPTPFSWYRDKDTEEPLYDFAVSSPNDNRQWKRVNEPFCYLWQSEEDGVSTSKVELYSPDRQLNIHTARKERQRLVKGESTVFRYDALAPGQVFCGVILSNQDKDLEILEQWLLEGESVSLGGSHLAGYGRARLEHVQIQDDWQEYNPIGEDSDDIVVTLLSDTLIRDPQTGAYVASLQPMLGVTKAAFVGRRIVGGFNRKWNLPLPQTLAIQAGSVFVYPNNPDLLQRLEALEITGIGERRAEGFGRIAVNWHRAAEIRVVEALLPSKPLPAALQDDTSVSLARRMAERMLRERLDQDLISAINQYTLSHPPSNAQLSRIRIVARQALAQSNPQIIIEYLEKMKKTARDQFQRARINNQRLDEWLRGLAWNPKEMWQNVDPRRINIGGIQPELTNALALEYTIRLIDQVLRKAQKEARHD
ncbi:MAG: hypothetical protein WHS83_14460 [Chloroflexus sp.]|uniref:hypothetical protein n=1 Tax=Chloroflexus sp. TaxID=1904827 RepID=UPI0030A9F5F4